MPGPLRWFAEHQPVSVVIDAVRPLFLGTDPGPYPYLALLWIVGIVAVFSRARGARLPARHIQVKKEETHDS